MRRGDLAVIASMLRGPGRAASAEERMERLYRPQAAAYDSFRDRFLHGREELLRLLDPPAGSTMVELGGGTGRTLEFLGPRLGELASATVVDICPSLLAVARERFRRLGLSSARAVQGDATVWRPEAGAPVDVVYFSYSLTMIPDWFKAVENALAILRPGGLLGAVDFHLARKRPGPGRMRQGALGRAFWSLWFGRDDVFPSPDLLPYLEHRTQPLHREERRGSIP